MAFTLITFVFFTALVAVISYFKTRDEDLTTNDGYFLAGRSLPGVVIAGSLLLTNLSAEQLVGLNGQSWASNMGPIAWEVGACATLLIMAFYFLPRYLKSGISTIPEMLEERYDNKTRTMITISIMVVYVCVNLPVVLYSGSLVFENIFGISATLGTSKLASIAIICVLTGIIGAIYAIFGGLKAVAVSDTINGVGLIIGGLMIPFLGILVLGAAKVDGGGFMEGLSYVMTAEPTKLNAINAATAPAPEIPWPLIFTGMFFNNLYSWCTNQSFVQRTLAAKNLKEAQKGAIYAGYLKLMGPLYLVFPGIIAYHLFLQPNGSSIVPMMDEAYPMLISAIVPKPLMGFFAAVMFGAILSSFNSILNSVVTMYSLDIHKRLINPKISDDSLVKLGKKLGIVIAVISITASPFVYYASSGITSFLNALVMFIAGPILAAVLGGFMFDRVPAIAPKVVFVFHFVFYLAFQIWSQAVQSPIHYLYAVSILFPIDMLIMYLYAKFKPTDKAYVQKDIGVVDMTPWKYRFHASAVAIILTIIIYFLFSPLGIAK